MLNLAQDILSIERMGDNFLGALLVCGGELMAAEQGSQCIEGWPQESREAAQLVIDGFGEPNEATGRQLTWRNRRMWTRIIAATTPTSSPMSGARSPLRT